MKDLINRIKEMRGLPRVSVDLMLFAAKDNDPFFAKIVKEFYLSTQKRHKKLPLIKAFEYGIALCELPEDFDAYFMAIVASGRRNFKKADRSGYVFQRIDYNAYREDIKNIRQSTDVRQGKLSEEFLAGEVSECSNPESKTDVHDYPYFGVLKDGKLVAYSGCFIAGELCMIEHIFGHAECQGDGVVPFMIISLAQHLMKAHPKVKYYGYGAYFGAGETMRRFKRKFLFMPHRVKWELGGSRN